MNSDGNQPPGSPAPAAVGSSPNSRGSRATPSSTRPSSQPVVAATPPSSARRGILSSPNVASDNLGLPLSSQGDNLDSLNASSPRTSDARMASQRTRSSDGAFNAGESAPGTPSSQRSRSGRHDLRAGHRVNRPLEYHERQPQENDGQGEQCIWGTTLVTRRVRASINDFFSNTTTHHAGNVDIRTKYEDLIDEALNAYPVVNLDCKDVMAVDQHLYSQLVLYPVEVIECFDLEVCDIARQLVERGGYNAEDAERMRSMANEIKVRPFNLRKLHVMRDLNPADIDQLVSFRGMIIRAAPIIPDLQVAFFECNVCKNTMQVELNKGRITEPSQCDNCRTQQSMIIIHNRCSFNDRQLVKCQESPGDIPQGETPHSVNLCAFDDMVDKAKPGDRVQITGIYRAVPMRLKATQRSLRSVYKTYIDVIHYKKTEQGRRVTHLLCALLHSFAIPHSAALQIGCGRRW
jgi:DNA replication licensing factor MCM4